MLDMKDVLDRLLNYTLDDDVLHELESRGIKLERSVTLLFPSGTKAECSETQYRDTITNVMNIYKNPEIQEDASTTVSTETRESSTDS